MGALFLVSVLALAGIGVAYAGFTDTITVYGSVETATVDINVVDTAYSGTDVYKVWGDGAVPAGEIYEWHGFIGQRPTLADIEQMFSGCNVELVASAWAAPGDEDDQVKMTWDNIFPCIDFTVDFILHYEGSIPAKIDPSIIIETMYEPDDPNAGWLEILYNYDNPDHPDWGITIEAHRCTPLYLIGSVGVDGVDVWENHPVYPGYQLHYCNYVYVEITIHLPQDDGFQGLYGEFTADLGVTQWNDQCYVPA